MCTDPPAFVDGSGDAVTDVRVLERISSLAIPPAWDEVWVCEDPLGHIQAVGTDGAGRRQYIYHPVWRERQDKAKFDRALELAKALPTARRLVARDLQTRGLCQSRLLAGAFRIIELASLRMGGEEYLQANGSRGLTTLLNRHAKVAGNSVTLTFPGKSGQRFSSQFENPALALLVSELQVERGQRARLLAWRDTRWHTLSAAQVNDYIRWRTRGEFTAKDFRTLRGSVVAASYLASVGPSASESAATRAIAAAVRHTAAELGNTPPVARASYIDPRVMDRYRDGQVMSLDRRRSPETSLRLLLG